MSLKNICTFVLLSFTQWAVTLSILIMGIFYAHTLYGVPTPCIDCNGLYFGPLGDLAAGKMVRRFLFSAPQELNSFTMLSKNESGLGRDNNILQTSPITKGNSSQIKYYEVTALLSTIENSNIKFSISRVYQARNKHEAIGKGSRMLLSSYKGHSIRAISATFTRQRPLDSTAIISQLKKEITDEKNAKNTAYHFIQSYGLYNLFQEFCIRYNSEDPHKDCLEWFKALISSK